MSFYHFISFRKHKKGFTLAEVLINLGIIGIVAAMTLPALMGKYQEHVLVTQAKKSYSVIMNAINAYNADHESLGDNTALMDYSKSSSEVLSDFSKYFSGAMVCKDGKKGCNISYKIKTIKPTNDGYGQNYGATHFGAAMILADGTLVSLRRETTSPGSCSFNWHKCDTDADGNYTIGSDGRCEGQDLGSSRCGRIMVDTNGEKGPNRFGSDVFTFQVGANSITFMNDEGDLNYILQKNKIQPYKDYTLGSDYK